MELRGESLVEPDLGTGKKAEFVFDAFIDPGTESGAWYAEGYPEVYNRSGLNTFYVDESGVLRYRDTGGSAFYPRTDAEPWAAIE